MSARYEYASFWIVPGAMEADPFRKLKELSEQGWNVVGEFLPMESLGEGAGVWILRRRKTAPAAP